MNDGLMMGWRTFIDMGRPMLEQMAYDERLAHEALPTVRSFVWKPPAISIGWKQSPPAWLCESAWRMTGLAWVERPSGGGVAFHGSDVSIAIVIPRTLAPSLGELMRAVCESAVHLCHTYGAHAEGVLDATLQERVTYCLTETSPYAVLVRGRKVAGFSLRRYPKSWLIQGSLLVRPLGDAMMRGLPPTLQRQLSTRAVSLSEATGQTLLEADVASRWSAHWASWWNESEAGSSMFEDSLSTSSFQLPTSNA